MLSQTSDPNSKTCHSVIFIQNATSKIIFLVYHFDQLNSFSIIYFRYCLCLLYYIQYKLFVFTLQALIDYLHPGVDPQFGKVGYTSNPPPTAGVAVPLFPTFPPTPL